MHQRRDGADSSDTGSDACISIAAQLCQCVHCLFLLTGPGGDAKLANQIPQVPAGGGEASCATGLRAS
ncbi:hypothetical protein FOA52_006305 [Chlamydomonas sp. UWO 241]|nr:hypothetical protein FOA52_006305 [Chlamydomonas sp. UWO 241]